MYVFDKSWNSEEDGTQGLTFVAFEFYTEYSI